MKFEMANWRPGLLHHQPNQQNHQKGFLFFMETSFIRDRV